MVHDSWLEWMLAGCRELSEELYLAWWGGSPWPQRPETQIPHAAPRCSSLASARRPSSSSQVVDLLVPFLKSSVMVVCDTPTGFQSLLIGGEPGLSTVLSAVVFLRHSLEWLLGQLVLDCQLTLTHLHSVSTRVKVPWVLTRVMTKCILGQGERPQGKHPCSFFLSSALATCPLCKQR